MPLRWSGEGLRNQVILGTGAFGLDTLRDRKTSIEALRVAYELGYRVFDTARAYTSAQDHQYGESLVADALRDYTDTTVIAKGGYFRAGPQAFVIDNSPRRLRADVETSLRALRAETIDLYMVHRCDDHQVPIEDSVGALRELQVKGDILEIGLSNASSETIDRARATVNIFAVENPHGIAKNWPALGLDDATEALRRCQETGIAYVGYSPVRWDRQLPLTSAFPATSALATERGALLHDLLLGAQFADSPGMSLITGSTRPSTMKRSIESRAYATDPEVVRAFRTDRALLHAGDEKKRRPHLQRNPPSSSDHRSQPGSL